VDPRGHAGELTRNQSRMRSQQSLYTRRSPLSPSRTLFMGMDGHKETMAVAYVAQEHGATGTALGTLVLPHCNNSPRRLNQSAPSLRGLRSSLRGELSERLAAYQAASQALAGAGGGTRWRGEKSAFKILILAALEVRCSITALTVAWTRACTMYNPG
jgi:hypothetical protein